MDTTSVVRLLELEEVWAQTTPFSFGCCQVDTENRSEIRPDYPVQGETLNLVVLRQVCLEVPEVLQHGCQTMILPLGDICEVRNHLDGHLAFFLMFHLGMDGFEVLCAQPIKVEETCGPPEP
jgi:hypothetical protein